MKKVTSIKLATETWTTEELINLIHEIKQNIINKKIKDSEKNMPNIHTIFEKRDKLHPEFIATRVKK